VLRQRYPFAAGCGRHKPRFVKRCLLDIGVLQRPAVSGLS
jgi:hypothetical protein